MALKPKPSPTTAKHLAAIRAGSVDKGNVIGIRKLLNGAARREAGLSIGMSTPKGTMAEANEVVSAIHQHKPKVVGALHEGGVKVLNNRRYHKRWGIHERYVIDNLSHFQLVDYEWLGNYHTVPVFRAVAVDGSGFDFRNVPWQSGGDGPEVVQ